MLVISMATMQHHTVIFFHRPVHLPAVSSYADQREVSVTQGDQTATRPCYGAKRPSVSSSAYIICIRETFVAHMLIDCDPHISRPPPTDFEGTKLSQIFRVVCEYIQYLTSPYWYQ